jgi:D-tyrosyl-tRNA(Tyr) deacylase
MRLVIQRVKSASVTVDSEMVVASIGPGVLALVGLHEHDTIADAEYCCKRLLACKLWENESGGQWRQGVKQKGYQVLLVSQFTLYGTLSKNNQPDYKRAMKSAPAEKLYGSFLAMVGEQYEAGMVQAGIFGEMMDVALVNDGPVTLVIESDPQAPDTEKEESDAERRSQL